MEENNNKHTNNSYNENEQGISRYWKELAGMLFMSFLGGFLAIYFVADQVFDRNNTGRFSLDRFERHMLNDFQKIYDNERKAFERDFGKFEPDWYNDFDKKFNTGFAKDKNKNSFDFSTKWLGEDKQSQKALKSALNPFILPDMTVDSVKIKTELENDKYKVIIGLNAFRGDDSNIHYNVTGRKLTVFGSSKVKEKKYEQDISFSQDFLLPYNADIANISKKKDGNKLVIEVPLKN